MDFGDLVIACGTALMAFFWVAVLMRWMAEGAISGKTGLVVLVVSAIMMAVSISSENDVVKVAILLLFVMAPFSLPIYDMVSGKASDRELDLKAFERAHGAFAHNPGNVGSRFEIARMLAKLGLLGHAIAIAKGAEGLLTDDQGPHQRGTRMMFAKELSDMRYWESLSTPEQFRNVKCRSCQRANPPGTIACLGCQAPFLLEIVRSSVSKTHPGPKIVLLWLVCAALVAAGATLGVDAKGWSFILPIVSLVIVAGGVCSWMLNDRIKF